MMGLTAKPFLQGKVTVISGPVSSEKTEEIEVYLNALVDSGFKRNDNVLVVRHPDDDPQPEMIGKHKVTVTSNVQEIYEAIHPSTATIIIVGASHYKEKGIVELADAVVRSSRNLVLSGLNLDAQGKPHGHMSEFMALADEVYLAKSICFAPYCRDEATRSLARSKGEDLEYVPSCAHHYYFPECPPVQKMFSGSLELYLGPMFADKSTSWRRKLRKVEKARLEKAVLKWSKDIRYGEKMQVVLHSGEKIPANLVNNVEEIKGYLKEHPLQRIVFLDEAQFFPNLYEFVFDFIPKGYKFICTGLPRGFNRKPFGDVPKLMCLADIVHINYAFCVRCFQPATESQRMKMVNGNRLPAEFDDPLIMSGGMESYEARCLSHWCLPGEPENKYKLDKFSWEKI